MSRTPSKSLDPTAIVNTIAATHIERVFDMSILDILEDERLQAAEKRLVSALLQTDLLTPDQRVTIAERIRTALPSDALRNEFFQYTESTDVRALAEREAAFRIGLAIGRRLAGGAR